MKGWVPRVSLTNWVLRQDEHSQWHAVASSSQGLPPSLHLYHLPTCAPCPGKKKATLGL